MTKTPISDGLIDPFLDIPRGEANIKGPARKVKTTSVVDSLKGQVPEWTENYQPKVKPKEHNDRSKALLEKHGFTWGKCEATNTWANTKHDLFGCMDFMAIRPGFGILGVQVTSYANAGSRFTKAKAGHLKTWLESGGMFVVFGWLKRGHRWESYCLWAALEDGEVVKKRYASFPECLEDVK